MGDPASRSQTSGVRAISLTVVLINLVFYTPFNKTFDVLSRFELQFLFFPESFLLLFEIVLCLTFQGHFFHHSINRLIFFDIGLQLFRWNEWQIIF